MVRLTREVRMTLDTAARPGEPGPRNGWAGWPRASGVAAFVAVRISVVGQPDPTTGYLCDIKDLDELLRAAVSTAMHNDLARSGPVESVVAGVWRELAGRVPPPAVLDNLEWLASPYLRFGVHRETPGMIRVTEQFEFAASHRLHCDSLSPEENKKTFGKCNNASGHGHNYILEVTLEGEPDPATGVVLPIAEIERIVAERVLSRFDHKYLNIDTDDFREINPSVENIARRVWSLLDGAFGPARLANVRVNETAKTWAEVSE